MEQKHSGRIAESLHVDLQVRSRESKTLGMTQVFKTAKLSPKSHSSNNTTLPNLSQLGTSTRGQVFKLPFCYWLSDIFCTSTYILIIFSISVKNDIGILVEDALNWCIYFKICSQFMLSSYSWAWEVFLSFHLVSCLYTVCKTKLVLQNAQPFLFNSSVT